MRSVAVALVFAAVSVLSCPTFGAAQEDAFSLEGLIVTASPTPRAAEGVSSHVTVLEGESLRALGPVSLGEALRDLAGLDVVRNGSFGALTSVFLRGGENDHTLVLVDGVQVNQAGGGFDFASLTLDNVQRIEVVRGPSSALYGSDAVAGVIHVVTRTGRGAPRINLGAETAHYSEPRNNALDGIRWSADVAGGSDRFGYSATLGRESTDGVLAFNNRFLRTVVSGNAHILPDDQTRVALTLRLTSREFHYPTDGSGQVIDTNAFGFGDEAIANVTAARRFSSALELQATLGVHDVDGGTDDAPDDASDMDGYESLDHFRRATGQLRANLSVNAAIVTLGAEVEEESQRSFSESASAFGPLYGRSENARENLAAFVYVTSDAEPLAFNAGARFEDNERFGASATWQGGVAAHLPGRPESRVRATVGTALKEPTFYENFAADGFSVGNPGLDPERSLSWEVGLDHELLDGLGLEATYFDQRFEDLIQYTSSAPSPGAPNFFNVAEARARGLEVGAEVRRGRWEAGAAYTWLDTEVENSGFDSGPGAYFVEGERLLRRPTHALALHAAATLADLGRMHARVSWVGSRADRSFDPATFATVREDLPGYVLWAAGAEWNVVAATAQRPSVKLSVRGENLLGETYEEAWGFRAPGRQLYVGLTVGVGGSD